MLGSIIGDIVGSIYEFHNIKTKDFPFFPERGEYTDDSILTPNGCWTERGRRIADRITSVMPPGIRIRWALMETVSYAGSSGQRPAISHLTTVVETGVPCGWVR